MLTARGTNRADPQIRKRRVYLRSAGLYRVDVGAGEREALRYMARVADADTTLSAKLDLRKLAQRAGRGGKKSRRRAKS